MQARLRGGNSPEAAYELSRALRRAEDVRGVQALYGQIRREKLAVRDRCGSMVWVRTASASLDPTGHASREGRGARGTRHRPRACSDSGMTN